jgi:hypothetical protein
MFLTGRNLQHPVCILIDGSGFRFCLKNKIQAACQRRQPAGKGLPADSAGASPVGCFFVITVIYKKEFLYKNMCLYIVLFKIVENGHKKFIKKGFVIKNVMDFF